METAVMQTLDMKLPAQSMRPCAQSLAMEPYSFDIVGKTYKIRLARDMSDRLKSWNFVHRAYAAKGYAPDNAQGLWYGIHDALPETLTFLTERDGRLVASLTLVFDSPIGIPADELYADSLSELRNGGRRLCEIVSLVNIEKSISAGTKIIRHLFKLAYLAAYNLESATDFVITVNPRHKIYYQKGLLFEEVGEERNYGKVNGAAAVLLRLDMIAAQTVYKERFNHLEGERNFYKFFRDRQDHWLRWLHAGRTRLTPTELEEHFLCNPNLCAHTSKEKMAYAAACYATQSSVWLKQERQR